MNLKDKFLNSLESIYLTLIMVWTVGIAVALVNPENGAAPAGSVEIYSLVAADAQPTA
jgi:hypothetical protein